jgi:hypothetical protein
MKKILYSALVAIVMIACQKYPEPEYIEPRYKLKDHQTLISIEELKARHTLGGTPTAIMGDTVIRGIVVADDESGHIYKSIYIQDETGGVNLAIDQVNMYNIMPVGQEVYVEMKGLFIGDYNNGYQIGDTVTDPKYGLEMARYNWANELYRDSLGNYSRKHIYTNGKPDLSKVPAPKVIESSNAITSDMYCSLVTLKNIRFTDPKVATGLLPWSTKEQTVNRTAEFSDGSTIVVRTSGYCNFYADFIPTGVGSITGILSIFGSTKQFYIRDREDIHTFIED